VGSRGPGRSPTALLALFHEARSPRAVVLDRRIAGLKPTRDGHQTTSASKPRRVDFGDCGPLQRPKSRSAPMTGITAMVLSGFLCPEAPGSRQPAQNCSRDWKSWARGLRQVVTRAPKLVSPAICYAVRRRPSPASLGGAAEAPPTGELTSTRTAGRYRPLAVAACLLVFESGTWSGNRATMSPVCIRIDRRLRKRGSL